MFCICRRRPVAEIVLWNELVAHGVRKADLTHPLGVNQAQVDLLLDFRTGRRPGRLVLQVA